MLVKGAPSDKYFPRTMHTVRTLIGFMERKILPISFSITSLGLGQFHECHSAGDAPEEYG